MTISWLCLQDYAIPWRRSPVGFRSDSATVRDSFSDSSLTLSSTSGYPCLPIRSLQPLAKAFCTDLTVQGLGSQVKVFLGQTKAWLNLCQRIAQCNPLKPLPVTSITYIYIWHKTLLLPTLWLPCNPTRTNNSIMPHDLAIRSFKRSPDVSSKCEQAAARIDLPRCTSEQQLKVNSLKRKSRTPENVTDIKTRDVWFCWGYECYPDIQALVKVTSPSEGLSFQDTTIQPHKLLLFCLYLVIWMCCIVGIIESLLCCIVLWSSVMYPLRHGIMASPLGQGMAPA